MLQNADGSWTFFNRDYKPLGIISEKWVDWDNPAHKLAIKGLDAPILARLRQKGSGGSKLVYFYADANFPEKSPATMEDYLSKLRILLHLRQA